MSKINTGKITGKIRVRIMRPWRGYPVGTVINPPAGLRQILLQKNDQLGNPIAEVVADDSPAPIAEVVADDSPAPIAEVVADDSQSKKQKKHK